MDVKQGYNNWANQYDTNHNRTRDLEAISLRENLTPVPFERCLEIGCGTGKNTAWLIGKARNVTAVDLSDEMLAKAKEKIKSDKVQFHQADITGPWTFPDGPYDLVTFSLVLEHIENLHDIFRKVAKAVVRTGYVYIGELHPFKQYMGTKARFDTAEGQQVVNCFNHHLSDFTQAAGENGFIIVDINEYFDNGDKAGIPRILTLILQKK
jgi:ubiquinone/menaquinone biosynthesis C-methylase UbiE